MLALIALSTSASAQAIDRGGVPFEPPDENHPGGYDPAPHSALVAFAHAPVHAQDTDDTDAVADYLAAVDFDGDPLSDNNWDNLYVGDLSGVVYYSFAETCTHYYVTYAMFHPRDWDDGFIQVEHENDMEGVLAIIGKDGDLGVLEGLVTVAHLDFYSFVPDGSPLGDGREDIDGDVTLVEFRGRLHPLTSQEAKGHGLKAWPHAGDLASDHVVYWPAAAGQVPDSGDDRSVDYRLEPVLDGLWPIQLFEEEVGASATFARFGTFAGDDSGTCDDCSADAAQAPWGWEDDDDGVGRGALALDPARLASVYFSGLDEDGVYVENPLAEAMRLAGFTDAAPPARWTDGVSLDALYDRLDGACR